MSELVSVIVPIYNVEKQLSRCVDSLICQTYKNIEIILVDDGSPDLCGKICDEYEKKDKRVRVIHRQNGGLSAARNSGIDAACGQLLSFVDPDDYVAPDFIEFMYILLKKYDADIASCGLKEIYPSGRSSDQCSDKSVHIMNNREALMRMCYNDGFFVTAGDKLYKRELFSNIRYPEGKQFEDTGATYLVVDRAKRIAACGEPKYFYVINPDSITNCAFNKKKLDYVEMADEMAGYIMGKYPELEAAAHRKQMHACFSTLTQLAKSDTREPEIEKMLTLRVKSLEKGALADPKTPRRDRIAIYSLRPGFKFFSLMFRIYIKLKKG